MSMNNPLNVPIRLRVSGIDQGSLRQAVRQLQSFLGAGVNWSDTILGAANPNTHWRSRGMGFQTMAYMDRAIMGRGGMPGMAGRFAAGMFGFGGGVNSLPAMAVQAVQTARQQEQAYSDLNRRVGESIDTYARFREEVIRTGRDIGLTRQQILSLTDAYVSGVGRMSSSVMSNNLQGLMNLSKALGISPDVTVGAATSLTRTGAVRVGASTQPIAAMMAAAIEGGGMRGRESETVKAIEDLGDLLAQRLPTVSQQQLQNATMLMTVLNSTGVQGLMGANGMRVIQSMDTFMQGTGGTTQKNLVFTALQMQAQREGRGPMDLLQLETTGEQGIGSAFGLKSLINMIGPGGLLPNSRITPLLLKYLGVVPTATQGQALLPALMAIKGGAGGGFDAITNMLGNSNVNPAIMPYLIRLMGGTEGVSGVLGDFGATMTPTRRSAFQQAALGVTTPQAAIDLIQQFGDSTQQLLTEQDKSTLAMTNFENALTDLATQMLPAVNGSLRAMTLITGGVAGALSGLNHIIDMSAVTFGAVALATGASTVAGLVSGGASLFTAGLGASSTAAAGRYVGRYGLGAAGGRIAGRVGGGIGSRAGLLTALAFGAYDTYQGISSGQDPMYAFGRTAFSVGGSILGGLGGSALMPGLGTIAGGIAGGVGGDMLFQHLFGDGVKLADKDQLAQDSTLRDLKDIMQTMQSQDAMRLGLDAAARMGPEWQAGGARDESTRAALRMGGRSSAGRGLNPFSFPMSGDGFGVYSSYQRGPHTGVDLGLPQGTAVGAFGPGYVVSGGQDPTGMGGNWLTVDYGNGIVARYSHLSRNDVLPVGAHFNVGDILAYSGGKVGALGSGTATTGPHLLLEAWKNGRLVDPNSLNLSGQMTVLLKNADGSVTSQIVPVGVVAKSYGANN